MCWECRGATDGVTVRPQRLPGIDHRTGAAGGWRHGDVMAENRGPLTGITVVALEQAVSAPMCTRVLADFGARVIKVENPRGGDFARYYDEVAHGLAADFVWANRGKESVTLDLKADAGRDILHRLLDRADVLVSNLAPGAVARLGVSAADLKQRHPNVIAV